MPTRCTNTNIGPTDARYRAAVYRVVGPWRPGAYAISTGTVVSALARRNWLAPIHGSARIPIERGQ